MFDANGNPLTEEEFGEVVDDAFTAAGSSSSSDSNKTIRGQGRDNKPTTTTAKSASLLEEPHTSTGSPVGDELTTVSANSSTGSPSSSIHPAELENFLAIDGPWQIQYSKIPRSSELSCGPVSTDRILKCFEGKKELVCRFSLP